jgi:K+-sensing histidine kinase KdpD
MLPAETAVPENGIPNKPPIASVTESPDLLSSVCHDLKEPLASIVMGAWFLRRSLPAEDQAAQRVVEAIHRAADRMNQLIASFSDLSRLQTHDLRLNLAPEDVSALVKTAFAQLVTEAAAHAVVPTLELDPGLPMLVCDRDRVLQILHQLGAGALRVVPEGGTIVVHASGSESGARIEVIAKPRPGASSRRIVSDMPKPAMAIARGLVELHGGRLSHVADGDALVVSFDLPTNGPA